MARIPTLSLETMDPEQQRIYRGVMARRGPVQGPLLGNCPSRPGAQGRRVGGEPPPGQGRCQAKATT